LTAVSHYTSLAGRLQVLASEQDPAMSEAFSRGEYERICAVLARFYNIIITDSGTGLVHSAMEGTLALADSLVVVGAPTVDGASRASKTLDWLVWGGWIWGRCVSRPATRSWSSARSSPTDSPADRRLAGYWHS
jgi:MinD-like ATPase involved in chromosome partitioning or flagellar assembly